MPLIKQFRNGQNINYIYNQSGVVELSISNNISSYSITGIGSDKIKQYLRYIKNINQNVQRLEDNCFLDAQNLVSVDMGEMNSITSIGDNCFKNCTQLKTFISPKNTKILPSNCFYGDTNLKFVGELSDELSPV